MSDPAPDAPDFDQVAGPGPGPGPDPDKGPADLTRVFVSIFVERDSQKAIVLGHKGSRLADVGRRVRLQIEPLLGTRVYLDLHVAVAKDWQRDPRQLRKLGFDN